MKRFLILSLILSLAACKSKKAAITSTSSEEKYMLETLAEVIKAGEFQKIYSENAISEGVDHFEEGTEKRAYSILNEGTENELLITWDDMQRTKVHQLRFEKEGTWKTRRNIKFGTTYDELVKLNGGPVKFYGFGWDYSGAVDWNGGKLENSKVRVFLAPQETPPNKFYGDKIVKATPEEIAALNLKVHAVIYQENL